MFDYIKGNTYFAYALGIVATILSTVIAYFISPDFSMSWLEFSAVATSFVCTAMCVTQNRLNYIFGVITTFLYCILFFQSGLYALAIFNGAMVISLMYGWWRWGPDGKPLEVTSLKIKEYGAYISYGILVAFGFILILYGFGAPISTMDVVVASLSAVAQLMLDNKRLQTWYIWFIVNVISLILFWQQALFMVFIQYIFFLINTIFGYIAWKKTM